MIIKCYIANKNSCMVLTIEPCIKEVIAANINQSGQVGSKAILAIIPRI